MILVGYHDDADDDDDAVGAALLVARYANQHNAIWSLLYPCNWLLIQQQRQRNLLQQQKSCWCENRISYLLVTSKKYETYLQSSF